MEKIKYYFIKIKSKYGIIIDNNDLDNKSCTYEMNDIDSDSDSDSDGF